MLHLCGFTVTFRAFSVGTVMGWDPWLGLGRSSWVQGFLMGLDWKQLPGPWGHPGPTPPQLWQLPPWGAALRALAVCNQRASALHFLSLCPIAVNLGGELHTFWVVSHNKFCCCRWDIRSSWIHIQTCVFCRSQKQGSELQVGQT